MLLDCRFDGAYSPAASFCVQWHEGGGGSNNAPNFAWSCPGYLARVMPRILRVVGWEKRVGTRLLGLVVGRVDECGSVACRLCGDLDFFLDFPCSATGWA